MASEELFMKQPPDLQGFKWGMIGVILFNLLIPCKYGNELLEQNSKTFPGKDGLIFMKIQIIL